MVHSAAVSGVMGRSTRCESGLSAMRRHAALDDGVPRQLRVDVGIVDGEVEASALASVRGALDDELGDAGDVAELEEIARHDVLPVGLGDLLLQEGDAARWT